MLTCDQCKDQVGCTYVHPATGRRFCQRCWAIFKPVNEHTPIDQCSDAVKNAAAQRRLPGDTGWTPPSHRYPDKIGEEMQKTLAKQKEEKNMKLELCAQCRQVSNDGGWIDTNLYLCGLCLNDLEDSGKMGAKHLKMKLRGSQRAIEFFHYICASIDTDWPWKKGEPKECPKCYGVHYVNPVLDAPEIRKIAEMAGVGKCKIKFFSDAKLCLEVK